MKADPRQPADARERGEVRKCVHCGFCTGTCPTYVLLGDELDSPRGRIALIKEMLETDGAPSAPVVQHIDRCLSCLSCRTTCPSDVDYEVLIDRARTHVEARFRRPWADRLLRAALAWLLPHPTRLRAALRLARLVRPWRGLLAGQPALARLHALLALAPQVVARPPRVDGGPATGLRRGRVLLLGGCAEPVLRPQIRAAAVRLLRRAGFDVAFAPGEGCCGALAHHMGRQADALAAARRNVDVWSAELASGALKAVVVTASGCGGPLKHYARLLAAEPDYAARATQVSALVKDVSELLSVALPSPTGVAAGVRVAYHAACSLQHGQQLGAAPLALLQRAGFQVRTPPEAHLCCGSAGVYNVLQPAIAEPLGRRKSDHLERLQAEVIATSNVGCAVQLAQYAATPVLHVVELLDWATGGPRPSTMPPAPDPSAEPSA